MLAASAVSWDYARRKDYGDSAFNSLKGKQQQ